MSNIVDSITNINFLSQEQFNSITAPSNNELYAVEFTPKGFNLFDYKLSNYTLNDPRWLSANAFTWQYCDYVDENYQGYKAAYEHLVDDYNSTLGEAIGGIISGLNYYTDTIGDIKIDYRLAKDGHKICFSDQETSLQKIYEATGAADYFILDQENKRFKLPRKQKRQLIQSWRSGSSWYNLYSNGWVEQGGHTTSSDAGTICTFPVVMRDTNYSALVSVVNNGASNYSTTANNKTTTHITVSTYTEARPCDWEVKGYAASVPTQTQLEYYYVGEYTIPALENTAGINTETLNNKVDRDFGNIPTGYDIVIDWQAPTAANNYTWYRKYKSGWVEQGGKFSTPQSTNDTYASVSISLPVTMANNSYDFYAGGMVIMENGGTGGGWAGFYKNTGSTATTLIIGGWRTQTVSGNAFSWEVKGMAATN